MQTRYESVRHGSVELDKRSGYWVLTHWGTEVMLRLRIQHGESADFDSADRIIFEAKLGKAESFHVLGEASVVSYDFLTEPLGTSAESRLCGCSEGFPWAFRIEFLQTVGIWGQLRMVSQVRPTMSAFEANQPPGLARYAVGASVGNRERRSTLWVGEFRN